MRNTSWQWIALSLALWLIPVCPAGASPVQGFVGWYHLLAERNARSPQTQELGYLLIDYGTLADIWAKYADSPLPANLEQYRNEATILSGFTHRDFLMLSFEALSTVTERYLRVNSGNDMLLEIYRLDDGSYFVGTRDGLVENRYLASPPTEEPTIFQRKYRLAVN